MPDPEYPVNVPADEWTKVATSVVSGNIRRIELSLIYLQTYRLTGEAAPTLKAEGVLMFDEFPNREPISSTELIDVYVWAVGGAGVLRVDV